MPAPRYKNILLYVKALPDKDVREIDEYGRPLMDVRVIGKENGQIVAAGAKIPYHAHYIARLKEGSLLAMDAQTAQLAGVSFTRLK